MRAGYHKYFFAPFFILLIVWTIACSGTSGKEATPTVNNASAATEMAPSKIIKMKAPDENTQFKLNNKITVILENTSNNNKPDSVGLYFNGRLVTVLKAEPWEFTIPASFVSATGRRALKAVAYLEGKTRTTITRYPVVFSDITPARNSYKVIHSYTHDKAAFTQGLFYNNGVLFEGTGQENGSSLREVELATGNVLRQLSLSPSLFGEGITLYNERIYQVTWTSKVGFVYDKVTFNQINKIYYDTQGWGLTTAGDKIVMSDGTHVLYFYDPESFTVTSQIEVYDNIKKVDQLNELEYINGEIWANIWNTDLIARVDPSSGKVLAYIDLKNILNDPATDTHVNVLNGIAFDKEGNRIFITGKNWPKLFEIKVTE